MANTQARGHYDPSDALGMFRAGMDTADIARFFQIHESEALRLVAKQRSALLDLPSPYPDASVRSLSVRNIRIVQSSGGG